MTASDDTEIRPFRLEISDAQIADLHDRLSRTRWSDDSSHTGWNRGVPATYLRILSDYWRHGYGLAHPRVSTQRTSTVHLSDSDRVRLDQLRAVWDGQKGYLVLQSNRPQTIAHGLSDSPVAQLAWIVDSVNEWTNPAARLPEDAIDLDQLLTNIGLYWFTRSGASAADFLYATAHATAGWVEQATVPTGWAVFNADGIVRRLMDPALEIEHWSEFTEGGHFGHGGARTPHTRYPGLLPKTTVITPMATARSDARRAHRRSWVSAERAKMGGCHRMSDRDLPSGRSGQWQPCSSSSC